jgi:hypothetical protein
VKTTNAIANFVGRLMPKCGGQMSLAVKMLRAPTVDAPGALSTDPSKAEKMLLREEVAIYLKDVQALKLAKQVLYSIIWGQCIDCL